MASRSEANSKILEAMWKLMSSLTSTTPTTTLETITTFFEPNAVVYLNGMSQPPCTNHSELIAATQQLITFWAIDERKVTLHVTGEDGQVIVNTMDNKLKIMGQAVEDFPECEVVKFSENGLIKEYLLFVDPSPVMAVFAKGNATQS